MGIKEDKLGTGVTFDVREDATVYPHAHVVYDPATNKYKRMAQPASEASSLTVVDNTNLLFDILLELKRIRVGMELALEQDLEVPE